eukprot:2497711-Pyramimonas_sp.AAC.1
MSGNATVSTLAGSGTQGHLDEDKRCSAAFENASHDAILTTTRGCVGDWRDAQFSYPRGVCVDMSGNILVAGTNARTEYILMDC